MNLLADESIERGVVERLRKDGHSVLYIADQSPGISDDQVLAQANQQDALLVTADKDLASSSSDSTRCIGGSCSCDYWAVPAMRKPMPCRRP